jgi:hypothetical protein
MKTKFLFLVIICFINNNIIYAGDSLKVKWKLEKIDLQDYQWQYKPFIFAVDSLNIFHQMFLDENDSLHNTTFYNKIIQRNMADGGIINEQKIDFKIGELSVITDENNYLITDPTNDDSVNIIVYDLSLSDTLTIINYDKYEVLKDIYSDRNIEYLGEPSIANIFNTHKNNEIAVMFHFYHILPKDSIANKLLCIYNYKTGSFVREILAHSNEYIDNQYNLNVTDFEQISFSEDGKYWFSKQVYHDHHWAYPTVYCSLGVFDINNDKFHYINEDLCAYKELDYYIYFPETNRIFIRYLENDLSEDFDIHDLFTQEKVFAFKYFIVNKLMTSPATISRNRDYILPITYDANFNNYPILDLKDSSLHYYHTNIETEQLHNYFYKIYLNEPENTLLFLSDANNSITAFSFNKDNLTDIKHKNTIESIALFPNPAKDYIEISFGSNSVNKGLQPIVHGGEFEIYDVLGNVVWKSNSVPSKTLHQSVSTTERIDISHLPRGVYLLKMGNQVKKFVVVR